MENIMSLDANTLSEVERLVTRYLVTNRAVTDQNPEWKDDLLQETVLVLLEGYGGVKIDGNKYFAVQMAATRLGYKSSCVEETDFDFTDEEAGTPRVSATPDSIAEIDLDDWMAVHLTLEEMVIAKMLVQEFTQTEIADALGVTQQKVSLLLKIVRLKIMKGGFNVN